MITWTITQLDCIPQDGENTNVVVSASWQCTATDDEYTAQNYGLVKFSLEQSQNFIPYKDLTQIDILNWCWSNGVNRNEIEASLKLEIQEQINPPIVTPPLPWSN